MKINLKKIAAILVVVVFTSLNLITSPLRAKASIGDWQKGVTIEPRWTTDFGSDSFKQSVDEAAADNVNYISLVVPYYQSNVWSTDIQPGWNTPTDSSLAAGIQYIHSKGLKAMLIFHDESYDGQWRANINPGDRATWYANYTATLKHIAQIGQANGAEAVIMGVEMIDMASQIQNSDNGTEWDNMIAQIRSIYSGQLSYGANWGDGGWYDEVDNINFWDKLDFIGISAYFNLNSSGDVASLEGQWDYWNNREIGPVHSRWNKPVVFTEIGYKSVSGSHYQPWNSGYNSSIDETEQANDYTALFDYWNRQPWFQGVQLWEWSSDPNAGGSGDGGYTPQHKSAEQVMASWFGQTSTTTPSPTGNVSFNSTATAQVQGSGQPIVLNAQVSNTGAAINSVIVDLEIYDNSSGQRAYQQFFSNQNFSASETKNYTLNWTPPSSDTYHLAIGVFNQDWTVNYNWNGNTVDFSAGQGSTPTPTATPTPTPTTTPTPSPTPTPTPTSNVMDIWWPTDGSHVSGVQPFKGLLEGWDLSQYNMYWQVDSGQLNLMGDSNVDWPHKEAAVDLSGWNWNSQGVYKLNFVAKDLSGNVVNQASMNIYVP